MEIERTDKEIIIRLPVNIKTEDLLGFSLFKNHK
jgi:hypothetical protein